MNKSTDPSPLGSLVIGGSGQIGREVARALAALGAVVAPPRRELDLLDAIAVRDVIRRVRPAVVVNAAAYTMVDHAESEPERCARLNAEAPGIVAAEARRVGAALVHFSTDYVFDGTKGAPYVETDRPAPLSVYGRTKLGGEEAVAAAGGAYLVVRTGWVYAAHGTNFVRTMLRLAREREELTVVSDQVGAPTSAAAVADGVAQVLSALAREPDLYAACEGAAGVYHLTAGGATTWYDFARTILADDPRADEQVCRSIRPIGSAEYGAPARRPAYSVLDNAKVRQRFGVTLPPWTEQWRRVAEQLKSDLRSTSRPASS